MFTDFGATLAERGAPDGFMSALRRASSKVKLKFLSEPEGSLHFRELCGDHRIFVDMALRRIPFNNSRLLRECVYKNLISNLGGRTSQVEILEYFASHQNITTWWLAYGEGMLDRKGHLVCLYKELEFFESETSVDGVLLDLMQRIINKIVFEIEQEFEQWKATRGNDHYIRGQFRDFVREFTKLILSKIAELLLSNKALHSNRPFIIISLLLRPQEDRLEKLDWRLFNAEIDMCRELGARNQMNSALATFVEDKTSLLQMRMTQQIQMLKDDENDESTRSNLYVLVSALSKIADMIESGAIDAEHVRQFIRLYGRVKKTKTIKQMLSRC